MVNFCQVKQDDKDIFHKCIKTGKPKTDYSRQKTKHSRKKKKKFFRLATLCVALSLAAIGCNAPAEEKATTTTEAAPAAAATKPDLAKMKADIQALETAWSKADDARDIEAVAAFYADDAISMGNNKPSLVGKAAILEDIKAGFAKKEKGSTVVYEVTGVFGDENQVTETGTTTIKDATGKVTYTGKYMAVWEKRDGKYICVRDIGNDDVKAK